MDPGHLGGCEPATAGRAVRRLGFHQPGPELRVSWTLCCPSLCPSACSGSIPLHFCDPGVEDLAASLCMWQNQCLEELASCLCSPQKMTLSWRGSGMHPYLRYLWPRTQAVSNQRNEIAIILKKESISHLCQYKRNFCNIKNGNIGTGTVV